MKTNKRRVSALLLCVLLLSVLLAACAATRIVHCDRCGKEITVKEDSNMQDDTWTIYCPECEHALGLDEIVPEE